MKTTFSLICLFLLNLTTSLYAAGTSEVGFAMEGNYELKSGGENCAAGFSMQYREDGNPYYCVYNEGPRIELNTLNGEKMPTLGCLDRPKHGSMIDYVCNHVWDAKTYIKKGTYNVQIRTGKKCVLRPVTWNEITIYSLDSDVLTIKYKKSSESLSNCHYTKVQ